MSDPLLKPSEAAAFLRVAERTLRRWRLEGHGPRWHRVVKQVRYAQSDLETFLALSASEDSPADAHGEPTSPSDEVVSA